MPFLDSLDIANRVCQRCGVQQILSIDEDSSNNQEITFAYDKLRRAELRRNIWTFAIKKAVLRPVTSTMLLLSPQQWSPNSTYMLGTIVQDANGVYWFSTIPDNLNNSPSSTSAWEEYFGPLAVDIFNPQNATNTAAWNSSTTYTINTTVSYNGTNYISLSSFNTNNVPASGSQYWMAIGNSGATSYYAGELCYLAAGNPGGFVIYMSLINGNTDTPSNVTPWNNAVQYGQDAIVSYNGSQWRSLIAVNLGITPAVPPVVWDVNAVYSQSQEVVGADGYIHFSLLNNNQGNNPLAVGSIFWVTTSVPAAWTNTPNLYPSSTNWLPIFAGLNPMPILYPLGAGVVSDQTTSNIFRLPAGYLRKANQAPKQGSVSWLGAPSGASYTDWEIEGKFITSVESQPIVFRFGADVTDVTAMDDMFCEGLACRIAKEVCERLTQSTSKLGSINLAYKEVMGDARTVNAIEVGSEESPEDDWLTVRL